MAAFASDMAWTPLVDDAAHSPLAMAWISGSEPGAEGEDRPGEGVERGRGVLVALGELVRPPQRLPRRVDGGTGVVELRPLDHHQRDRSSHEHDDQRQQDPPGASRHGPDTLPARTTAPDDPVP